MSRPEPNFTFGPTSGYGRQHTLHRGWLHLLARIVVLVLFMVAIVLLMKDANAGTLRTAVINDPASATAQDVKLLIRDDLEVYLRGGVSALGWSMHRVTPTQLVVDFRANEVAASRKYLDGSDIVISGTVRMVTVTLNTPRIDLGGVSAFMRTSDDWLASLKPGQRVTVVCRRVRQVLGMVGAYDCESRTPYVQRMVEAYFHSMHGLAQGGDPMAAKLLAIASR